MNHKKIRVEVDHDADAAYIRLSDLPVARTEELAERLLVDLAESNAVVGVEVLGLDPVAPLLELAAEYGLDEGLVGLMQQLLAAGRERPSLEFVGAAGFTPEQF